MPPSGRPGRRNPALVTSPSNTCTFPAPASATAATPPGHAVGSKRCRSSRRRPSGSTTPATPGTGARPLISPGCISRQEFETDTRCHDNCPRDIAAGLVCAPHGRGHRHCVHFLAPGRRCYAPGGCGKDCPADTRGLRCTKHGYTWEHCPHGDDACRHGYPAGVIPIPGDRPRPGPAGRLFFATREAAEADLYRRERERAGQAARPAPRIKELRRAMADTHPDRGGTAEQFIQARRRYETALRLARR